MTTAELDDWGDRITSVWRQESRNTEVLLPLHCPANRDASRYRSVRNRRCLPSGINHAQKRLGDIAYEMETARFHDAGVVHRAGDHSGGICSCNAQYFGDHALH